MHSKLFLTMRAPSLLLAAALQLMPLIRTALPAAQSASSLLAIIFRWGAAAVALGAVDAVSGASTVITTPMTQKATNGSALGTSQIRLATAPDQAHYWTATGLPPGILLSGTNGSTNWRLLGTPTQSGTFNVALTAKDQSNSGTDRTVKSTMVITVVNGPGGNSPPVANAQSVTTAEDSGKAITLTGSDPNSNPITFAVVALPAHGALSGIAPNLTYTPATNYNGSDSFTFKVNDGTVDSPTATISITVTAVNDPPVATSQNVATSEDSVTAITLAATDADGNPLTYLLVTQPTHGVMSGNAPNLTYTPATNYSGPDNFTFKVNDGTVDSPTATVSITVTAVNDPPLATPQSVGTDQNVAKAITLTGSDVEGSALTFSVVVAPTHGTLSGVPPNVTYSPATNYSGADSFTFKANDGTAESLEATVTISIAGAVVTPAVSLTQTTVGAGGVTLSASGNPDLTWLVERAPEPGGPWSSIGNLIIGAQGTGSFTDPNPPTTGAFYRATKN